MIKSFIRFIHSQIKKLVRKEWIGSPDYEALRFTLIYIFVGIMWILWSDNLLIYLVKDIDLIILFQNVYSLTLCLFICFLVIIVFCTRFTLACLDKGSTLLLIEICYFN